MGSKGFLRQSGRALIAAGLAVAIGTAPAAWAMPDTLQRPLRPVISSMIPPVEQGMAIRQVFAEAAAWRGAEAKQARNALIANWLGGLHEAGLADYSVRHLDKGLIYAIRFRNPVNREDINALWLAVPDGPDLPSSVLLRTPHEGTRDPAVLEHQSCTSRRKLEVPGNLLSQDQAEARAVTQLSHYLEAPDPMPITVLGEARDICRQLSRVLPSPAG